MTVVRDAMASGSSGSRESAGSSDQELLCHSESDSAPPLIPSAKSHSNLHRALGGYAPWGLGRGSMAAMLAGLMVLLFFATLAGTGRSEAAAEAPPAAEQKHTLVSLCSFDVVPSCPALDLLQDPAMHGVVAENLMRVGHGLLGSKDERQVREAVAGIFRNMTLQLEARAPAVARQLLGLRLSEARWGAILGSLRLVRDPRLQSVGLDVARACRGSGTTDKALVREYISEKLQPRVEEIKRLRSELISPQLAELWDEERLWAFTLSEENLHTVQKPSDTFVGTFVPFEKVDIEKKQFGVLGGVVEEFRLLLDLVQLAGRRAGVWVEVPEWAATLADRVSPKLLQCELATLADNKVDAMKALFCPLKFGAQGMDALRAADDMASFGAARAAEQAQQQLS